VLVFLEIDSSSLFADQWLYVHSKDLQMGRITNFRNWVPSMYGESQSSILALEYWCFEEDKIWKTDNSKIVDLAVAELRSTGLLKEEKVKNGKVFRISKSYPVYKSGYTKNLKKIEDYLSTINNLTCIGRYGAFKYNNQDHSILMGILAAENISEGTDHNLWDINTDYEYQESSIITEDGISYS
jgi:protoporphyrinogen oxidase